jgi:hypothetical protein
MLKAHLINFVIGFDLGDTKHADETGSALGWIVPASCLVPSLQDFFAGGFYPRLRAACWAITFGPYRHTRQLKHPLLIK